MVKLALFPICILAVWAATSPCVTEARHGDMYPYGDSPAVSPSELAPPPSGPSLPPSPSGDCSAVMYAMMPCLDYITVGSNTTEPPKACCAGVDIALKTGADCICQALKQSGSMGIQVNMTRAISLPSTCSITTPLPKCDVSPSPSPSSPPSSSPSPSPSSPSPIPSPPSSSPSPSPTTPSPITPAPMTPSPVNPPSPPEQPPASSPGPAADDDSPAPAPGSGHRLTISFNPMVGVVLVLIHFLGSFIY